MEVINLIAIFSATVTAIATVVLCMATITLAKETKILARMTSHPFVTGTIESSAAGSHHANFVLRNTGNAPAFDIKIVIKPALPDPAGAYPDGKTESVFDLNILQSGSTAQLRGVLVTDILGIIYDLEIVWSNYPGGKDKQNLKYKVKIEDGFRSGWTVNGTHQIAEEMSTLNANLSELKSIFKEKNK